MERPELRRIDLNDTMTALLSGRPILVVTMSKGQWDALLSVAYQQGHTLLELDADERPVAAYRKERTR